MKIQVTNYTFNATAKTITFNDYSTISLSSVLLITNVTQSTIIYSFADTTGTTSSNVLTLSYDTTYMSNGDKLLIYYDDPLITQETQALTGVSTNGSVSLAVINTWYQVPQIVPVYAYTLLITQENVVGTLRMAFSNTGTPGTSNGNIAPEQFSVDLGSGNAMYISSDNAGDTVNWTAKVK